MNSSFILPLNYKLLVFLAILVTIAIGVTAFSSLSHDPNSNNIKDEPNPAPLHPNKKDFVFGFYSEVAQQNHKENLFFSPLGIDMAFSLAYEGAGGETAKQMQQVFDFEEDDQKRGELVKNLISGLNSNEDQYKLNVANALWIKNGYTIKENYLDSAQTSYDSTVDNVDFVTNEGVDRINSWVREKTQNKIPNILPPDSTDDFTRMVITNAVYFNAKWSNPFNAQKTTEEPFWIDKDRSVNAKMMNHPADMFSYGETNDLQALKLYYVGGEASMLILLPKERDGIYSLEQSLDSQKINSIQEILEHRPLTVKIPKFEFETEYNLVGLLRNLGVNDAFDRNKANFEGITDEQVYVDQAKHKAFVSVDEEGTEAAAITAIVVRPTSGPPTPQQEFIADHPFVFLIQDNETGEILFLGRIMNPN